MGDRVDEIVTAQTPMDAETSHVVHQFVAAILMTLCQMTSYRGQVFEKVEIAPHPVAGLDHLRPWFGGRVVAGKTDSVSMTLAPAAFDQRFRKVARDRMTGPPPPEWSKLRGDGTLTASARMIIKLMLKEDIPTIERLVAVSGTSRRTLQRHFGQENTSFSAVLDDVRREHALHCLETNENSGPLSALASELGFSGQSTLTRAMRRWTGKPPTMVAAMARK